MNIQNAKSIAKTFLKKVEKLELVGYPDSGGIATNGYGNTHNAAIGVRITIDQAEYDLDKNIDEACSNLLLHRNCDDLNDHQGAALISFVFNAGAGNWQIWKCPKDQITTQLARFDHYRDKETGQLKISSGLDNRRSAEIYLFNTADIPDVSKINDFAPNTLNVTPKPNISKVDKANTGVKTVSTVVAASLPIMTVKATGFSIILPYIVGFSIGCVFCLAIGAIFYYIELNKPKVTHKVITVNRPLPQWITNLMGTSQAFQDALAGLLKAKDDEKAQAVADAVKAAETAADQDAIAAIQAATPIPPTVAQ